MDGKSPLSSPSRFYFFLCLAEGEKEAPLAFSDRKLPGEAEDRRETLTPKGDLYLS